jgi:hypothetical protein
LCIDWRIGRFYALALDALGVLNLVLTAGLG